MVQTDSVAVTVEGEEHNRIYTAVKLLAKAQSSNFVDERSALAGRAYRELAHYLNALDQVDAGSGSSGTRRRERRHLNDRRRDRQNDTVEAGPADESAPTRRAALTHRAAGAYRRPSGSAPGAVIDLRV